MGAGEKDTTFEKYLNKFGLGEKETPLTPEEKAKLIKKTDETADKIKAAFKAGNYKEVRLPRGT